jgi:hypothetical protein
MSSRTFLSSLPTEESYSGPPNLSDGSQGSSLEDSEDQPFTPKGAKYEREVTKDSSSRFCCNRSRAESVTGLDALQICVVYMSYV